jgi:hypothetical protein
MERSTKMNQTRSFPPVARLRFLTAGATTGSECLSALSLRDCTGGVSFCEIAALDEAVAERLLHRPSMGFGVDLRAGQRKARS